MDLVDTTINYANDHIKERLVNGEDESEVSTMASSKISVNSMATKSSHTKSSHAKSSHVTPPKSVEKSVVETQQQEVKDANDRLKQLEKDQQTLEQELQKKCETFELNKERIKDARSIVFLNEARAKATELLGKATEDVTVGLLPVKNNQNSPENMTPPQAFPFGLPPTSTHVKLKGVELPIEFEAWNAAFTSVVDDTNMPVKEKMLRLQNCLRGKALETVRDLGYSDYAYEKAKEKLERKYSMVENVDRSLLIWQPFEDYQKYGVIMWKTWKNYWQSSFEYWLHCKMVTKMEN